MVASGVAAVDRFVQREAGSSIDPRALEAKFMVELLSVFGLHFSLWISAQKGVR